MWCSSVLCSCWWCLWSIPGNTNKQTNIHTYKWTNKPTLPIWKFLLRHTISLNLKFTSPGRCLISRPHDQHRHMKESQYTVSCRTVTGQTQPRLNGISENITNFKGIPENVNKHAREVYLVKITMFIILKRNWIFFRVLSQSTYPSALLFLKGGGGGGGGRHY